MLNVSALRFRNQLFMCVTRMCVTPLKIIPPASRMRDVNGA